MTMKNNNVTQSVNITIWSKAVTGLMVLSLIYFLVDRPTLRSIRQINKTPFGAYFPLFLILKYLAGYVVALLLQMLYYGQIDGATPSAHIWATPVLFFFLFLELAPIFVEFYLALISKSTVGLEAINTASGHAIPKTISQEMKDEWLTRVAKAETSVVLDELLNNHTIKLKKHLYSEIVNLNARWNFVEAERRKGMEDTERLFRQFNNISISLIKIIEKL